SLDSENLQALEKGFANLERHYRNVTDHYGMPCVICINHFSFDSDAEIALLQEKCQALGAKCVVSRHWAEGGAGAEQLAREVISVVDEHEPGCNFLYPENMELWRKIETIARKIYGAGGITADAKIRQQLAAWQQDYGHLPICMAKTQMSFSTDPTVRGAPSGHTVEISEVRLANGAGFIVAIAGNMMTMPGLPKIPAAERIDLSDDGVITGLF
ncbi:formate--tetrahydrofolate ligase, partial [Thiolapillus sp.]|uniref:formate--tetrahydrofolate ligase n=1 Tax=Thiolapillus sp. TaxID=2017437 RepID=UPI003AF81A60